jgi:hypothetical protein
MLTIERQESNAIVILTPSVIVSFIKEVVFLESLAYATICHEIGKGHRFGVVILD